MLQTPPIRHHHIQMNVAPRAVRIADRILLAVAILGTKMTDIFVQAIPEDAAAVVIYFTDENEYESVKKALLDIKAQINKPFIACLDKSIKVLNHEDLESFGLQKIPMDGSTIEN